MDIEIAFALFRVDIRVLDRSDPRMFWTFVDMLDELL